MYGGEIPGSIPGISGAEAMKLTSFQQDMVDKALPILEKHRLVYLALETRTGKTPVSIMICQKLAYATPFRKVLFCTKKSVIPGIQKTIDGLREDYDLNMNIQIVSFDSLHKVTYEPGRIIIVDEAHSFGTYPKPSKRAIMLAGLARGSYVIFLSATPTPESYSQIYHQLWAAGSDSPLIKPYRNFYAWARDYVDKKDKFIGAGRKAVDYSHAKQEIIMPYLQELSVTGTKQDAGFEHCAVKEIIVDCPLPDEAARLIHQIEVHGLAVIDGDNIIADSAVSRMSKVHQIASGSVIGENQTHLLSDHKCRMIRIVQMAYPKLAVYYKYIGERDLIMNAFPGRITADADEFNASKDKIYAGQYLSKREGLDLRTADALIMYNIDFAYLSYEQTKNRIMNMFRDTQPVMIWLFSSYPNRKGKPGSIERQIYEAVCKKKNYTASHYKRTLKDVII